MNKVVKLFLAQAAMLTFAFIGFVVTGYKISNTVLERHGCMICDSFVNITCTKWDINSLGVKMSYLFKLFFDVSASKSFRVIVEIRKGVRESSFP